MNFTINGKQQSFIPIKTFRDTHQLASDFGVAIFEPKDFVGLAVIDKAGAVLQELRQALLEAISEKITVAELLTCVDTLREMFRAGLHGSNQLIGLKPEEVEFAVSGFGDVLTDWAYELIQKRSTPADIRIIYYQWLQNSLRLSQTIHTYQHDVDQWQIQIVNHVYGRMGLLVIIKADEFYVLDGGYTCPAQGYMQNLLTDIGQKIAENFA